MRGGRVRYDGLRSTYSPRKGRLMRKQPPASGMKSVLYQGKGPFTRWARMILLDIRPNVRPEESPETCNDTCQSEYPGNVVHGRTDVLNRMANSIRRWYDKREEYGEATHRPATAVKKNIGVS